MERWNSQFGNLRKQWSNYTSEPHNTKVVVKIGVAWVIKRPGSPMDDPMGWEAEIIDTPIGLSQRSRNLLNWLRNPPSQFYDTLSNSGSSLDTFDEHILREFDPVFSIPPNEYEIFKKTCCRCKDKLYKNTSTNYETNMIPTKEKTRQDENFEAATDRVVKKDHVLVSNKKLNTVANHKIYENIEGEIENGMREQNKHVSSKSTGIEQELGNADLSGYLERPTHKKNDVPELYSIFESESEIMPRDSVAAHKHDEIPVKDIFRPRSHHVKSRHDELDTMHRAEINDEIPEKDIPTQQQDQGHTIFPYDDHKIHDPASKRNFAFESGPQHQPIHTIIPSKYKLDEAQKATTNHKPNDFVEDSTSPSRPREESSHIIVIPSKFKEDIHQDIDRLPSKLVDHNAQIDIKENVIPENTRKESLDDRIREKIARRSTLGTQSNLHNRQASASRRRSTKDHEPSIDAYDDHIIPRGTSLEIYRDPAHNIFNRQSENMDAMTNINVPSDYVGQKSESTSTDVNRGIQ